MRISYVLPSPELGGGNKVVFQHADLLQGLGHEVTILGQGGAPRWLNLAHPYIDYQQSLPHLPPQDLVITTFWVTIATAQRLALGPMVHFCQGYEGGHHHFLPQVAAIEAAYGQPRPAWAVTPFLKQLMESKFQRPCRVVPPPVDGRFRPRWRWSPRRRPWIAVPGVFEAKVKGVATALATVKTLRQRGIPARVLRFSTVPLGDDERGMLEPDDYFCAVRPEEIARQLRQCDLLLMPSEPEEGFGLPMLEAMASHVPVVASRIPSTEFMAGADADLVPVGDVPAFAAAAYDLLTRPRLWRAARRRGGQRAWRFAPSRVAEALDEAVHWAATYRVEDEVPQERQRLEEPGERPCV